MRETQRQSKVSYYAEPRVHGNSLGITIPSRLHRGGLVNRNKMYKVTLEAVETQE